MPMMRWMAQWAMALTRPSELGYSDDEIAKITAAGEPPTPVVA